MVSLWLLRGGQQEAVRGAPAAMRATHSIGLEKASPPLLPSHKKHVHPSSPRPEEPHPRDRQRCIDLGVGERLDRVAPVEDGDDGPPHDAAEEKDEEAGGGVERVRARLVLADLVKEPAGCWAMYVCVVFLSVCDLCAVGRKRGRLQTSNGRQAGDECRKQSLSESSAAAISIAARPPAILLQRPPATL